MKLYIYKSGNLEVAKETTTQSILSDLFTCGFFIVLFACGIAFELFVGRSWLIELAISLLMFLCIFGNKGRKTKETTKEELIKMIEEL
jgi:hypothetical protein